VNVEERILKAARALIRDEGWTGFSMSALARRAGLTLAELYRHVPSRAALLGLFLRETDLEVLAMRHAWSPADRPRDRVFDVLMTRFEKLAAERELMRALAGDLRRAPLDVVMAMPALVSSMQWMLEAADVEASAAASLALAVVYASVLPVWIADDDPGLAKTMAALDRRLRRIEQLLQERERGAEESEPAAAPKKPRRKRKK
jgi:AcrR family transcriptional regulator